MPKKKPTPPRKTQRARAKTPPAPVAEDAAFITPKQQAFVEHYLRVWNGAEAARLAGYAENSARQQASDLLTKPYILEYIAERLAALKMSADEVLVRLAEHARVSIGDFLDDEDNEISLSAARQRGKLHLAKRLSVTTHTAKDGAVTVSKTIEPHDAQAALALIGKHLKLFVERVHHSGGVGGGPPVIDPSELSDDELAQLERILQKVNAKNTPRAP